MINKRAAIFWAIILVIVTAFGTFVVTNTIAISLGNKVVIAQKDFEAIKSMDKLMGLKEYIKSNYVEGAEDNKLIEGAIKGMFESLGDPYSVYMTKEEFKNFNESTKGSYGGIGVIVSRSEDGYVTVVAPIEDTPGEKAGLKTNDKIIKVDDKDIVGIDLEEAVALMKGKKGTKVTLTVMRDNVREPKVFVITREEIILKTVKSNIMENNIGYIRISMFDEDTGSEFKKALKELTSKNMKGLILDLRQNPGGFINQCVDVADELLDEGLVVYTEDKEKKREDYKSGKGKLEVPFVVLIDEGSASASEIVSGAVKDRKAGLLIGVKTFGKGLVQSIEQLKDGSGIKLTTQKYYTPNGISINKVGIQPDIEVKALEPEEGQKPEDVKDVQLERAVEELLKQIK
ncbi:MAG TPA: S41 family peptidase [Bacillota bacterium]|jgi:carboxyl-terminal processing protease|nr:S41 family peptidase [Bacillota bacterium]HRS21228.1 S41 family peptidase [Clostridia bacterium]HRU40850.1 S41 family peptidase [Candidatus Diapherotrites archaeon]HQI15899.1 S41 family peptidase [Bacillota bacterium]HQJ36720.1 S41 family peptidase [Bacillota bacterium]